jgi:type I restriction enzyme S subunit
MFGDPVKNEKGWEIVKIGKIVNELKYGTNEKSFEYILKNALPVIRIPNVLYGKVSFDNLKYSIINDNEIETVKLRNGDILFVRSNGNPNYIGRCAVFKGGLDCVFASYLIRARLNTSSEILPEYLQFFLSTPEGRKKLLKQAKTTAGNYNISTERLREIEILNPPLQLQNKFASIVEQVEKTKAKMQESLKEMDNLFNSLMQRAFKGEI